MGSRSKMKERSSRVDHETWEAYCESCSWHWSGKFEDATRNVESHQRENAGHLVHLVSDWKAL